MEPIGIRNNNPLNIKVSKSTWIGKVQQNGDAKFEKFSDIVLGIRAAMLLVKKYIEDYKLDTPSKIISRWAPISENATTQYIKTVAEVAMIAVEERISVKLKNRICRLLWAMAFVEVGVKLSFALFETAYELAFNKYNTEKLSAWHSQKDTIDTDSLLA